MERENTVLYMHAGSGNHGCEAIVRSTLSMLGRPVDLLSVRPEEDRSYSLEKICRILTERRITDRFSTHLYYFLKKALTRDPMCYISYRFDEILREPYEWAVSIGGDNYCYPQQVEELMLLNRALTERGSKTLLWGASLEPSLLKRRDVREDMERYSHIFARETVSYEALCKAGISREKLHCYPDPAFCLETAEAALPEGFQEGNTVGINLSPLLTQHEPAAGITVENYRELIRQLLQKSDMQIALLPHVVWESNDDRSVLAPLYEEWKDTGRILMLPDSDCMTLKGYISRLRFLVTARTHASIAAYSSKVPTLVVGYSVKAEGIAVDLFGTGKDYVVPVQELAGPEDLALAFWKLTEREAGVRRLLEERIPACQERAGEGGALLGRILADQWESAEG